MKKSIKKLLALALTGAFLVGALTGCGKSGKDDKTITVAASATPHAEILEYAKDKYIYKVWEDRGSSEPEVLRGVEEDGNRIGDKKL